MSYTVRRRGAVGSAKQREYLCFACGQFASLQADPPPDQISCPTCARTCERTVSAPPVHTAYAVSVARGPSAKPPPTSTDYMALGEGKPREEWKSERRKFWRDRDYKRRKAAIE